MLIVAMNSFAQFEQRRGKSVVKDTPQTAKNYSSKTDKIKITRQSQSSTTSEEKVQAAAEIAYGYYNPSLPDGFESGFNLGLSIAFGPRYNINDEIFAETMVGYKYLSSQVGLKGSKDSDKIETTIHDITFPIHIGYRVDDNITIYAGTRIDVPVSAKQKAGKEDEKVKIPTTALIECGIGFKSFRIQYSYSPSDKLKYSLFSISFAY